MIRIDFSDRFSSVKSKYTTDNIFIHPTNSCYGFGASIYNEEAYNKIYEIKGRDSQKPFFITISHLNQIGGIAEYDKRIDDYISKYPDVIFTFILKRSSELPSYINPGFETIGIQIATGILKEVCQYFDGPIFGTSANISGEKPIYKSKEVQKIFQKHKDITFLDGGDLTGKQTSTIIDLTQDTAQILRGTL